ncbi:MAG: aminoacyl-tRNA hydrolase, partial [Candidatus Gracilibacteria bacterium]|nr:aminoacyl-tRNA hydrolase [Candidatus Gracilibacteria bacterium]
MKLIIGLGNPGKQYENTRHNIGFRIVDSLAEKLGPSEWKASEKHQAQILETNFQLHTANYRLILVKPK